MSTLPAIRRIAGVMAILFGAMAAHADFQYPTLTDAAIAETLLATLRADPDLRNQAILVEVDNGIVTLNGETANILQKNRAAQQARLVKGVRAVMNRLHVQPTVSLSDAELTTAVRDALRWDPATELYDVSVAVENGVVTLTGTLGSWPERTLAENVASSVRGVRDVTNSIRVNLDAPRPDVQIQADIERNLDWNAMVDDGMIDVRVKDGAVMLSGMVASSVEKTEARTDAWVSGVTSVDDSELEVAKWIRDPEFRGEKYFSRTDAAIQEAVVKALQRNPRVSAYEVTPEVANGGVTLRGTVDNMLAKREAAETARWTVGVNAVNNLIDVDTSGDFEDGAIEAQIRSAIVRNPYLDAEAVQVRVEDRIVHLTGSVDTYSTKGKVESIVSRERGVLAVENDLTVEDTASIYAGGPDFRDDYISTYQPAEIEREPGTQTDEEIRTAILTQMWWSPFVDSDNITVTVENGRATLAGHVASFTERRAALYAAYRGGALYVEDMLTPQQ